MDDGGRLASLLVLGGARSGKSGFAQACAEARAEASGLRPIFIATAQPYDEEMAQRIAAHAGARDARWHLIEAPYDLADALERQADRTRILLIDCVTLWLSNILLRGDEVEAAIAGLAGTLARIEGPVVLVSNEVGAGIVPDTALGRRFRDAQGRLNQALASACDAVVLVTAGLPLQLKPRAEPDLRF